VDAGVDTARLFLNEGVVIKERFQNRVEQEFRVEKPGPLAQIPLAVTVNQNTASAAEIIAGALLELGRAPLIGTPTFGKDSIQLVFNLKDESSLHVTAGRWWFPGKDAGLGGQGIQPTVSVIDDPANPSAVITAASEWFNLE
jgi:carboxyl-terminal processing protease